MNSRYHCKKNGNLSPDFPYRLGMALTNPFTEHPHSAGETYREHMGVALGVSRQLTGAAWAAFVHALVPRFHETTAGDKIRALNRCLERHDREGLRRGAEIIAMPEISETA